MIVSAIFFTPTFPLADAYALRGLSERGRTYGPVRLWSSAAYIAANLGSGFVIGMMPKDGIMWLISSAFRRRHRAVHHPHPGQHSSSRLGAEAAAREIAVAHASVRRGRCGLRRDPGEPCSLLRLLDDGLEREGFERVDDRRAVGAWRGRRNRAVCGIGPCRALRGAGTLVILGAVGGIVRWTAMAFDPPFVLLPFLQCLHALSFCATHMGAMQFLTSVAPPGQMATAQGDLAAAHGVVFSVAMGLSGLLFSRYGDFAYLAMTLLCVLGLAAAYYGKSYSKRRRAPYKSAGKSPGLSWFCESSMLSKAEPLRHDVPLEWISCPRVHGTFEMAVWQRIDQTPIPLNIGRIWLADEDGNVRRAISWTWPVLKRREPGKYRQWMTRGRREIEPGARQ